jgi:hypothetical protein
MPLSSDDPYLGARLAVVERINRDRASAGSPAVEFDPFSSVIGDRHCQEMAARQYLSHWDTRGLLPYHRYHFAGGRDHVQESLSRMTMFSNQAAPISAEPEGVRPLLLQSHQRFASEEPPLDGHRRTLLDPVHTHVGIGLAVVGPEFTMAEEYVNRYVQLAELPLGLPPGAMRVEGQMLRQEFGPYYCVVFHEPFPQPRTPAQLERTYAYSDMEGDECANIRPWEMEFDRGRGRFRFSLRPKNCGPGFYHLLLWVRNDIRSIPYQLHLGTNKIDTHNAVPAAGWVFRSSG